MRVQGIDLVESFDKIKLPESYDEVIVEGLLPELHAKGEAFLLGKDGKLYRRTVNTGHHVGIIVPPKKKRAKKSS